MNATGGQYIKHCHAFTRFINSWHDIRSFLFWGPNSLRSNMWTPGRIKNSGYHAHEFYKAIKSVAMLYILSACGIHPPAKPSRILRRKGDRWVVAAMKMQSCNIKQSLNIKQSIKKHRLF